MITFKVTIGLLRWTARQALPGSTAVGAVLQHHHLLTTASCSYHCDAEMQEPTISPCSAAEPSKQHLQEQVHAEIQPEHSQPALPAAEDLLPLEVKEPEGAHETAVSVVAEISKHSAAHLEQEISSDGPISPWPVGQAIIGMDKGHAVSSSGIDAKATHRKSCDASGANGVHSTCKPTRPQRASSHSGASSVGKQVHLPRHNTVPGTKPPPSVQAARPSARMAVCAASGQHLLNSNSSNPGHNKEVGSGSVAVQKSW